MQNSIFEKSLHLNLRHCQTSLSIVDEFEVNVNKVHKQIDGQTSEKMHKSIIDDVSATIVANFPWMILASNIQCLFSFQS